MSNKVKTSMVSIKNNWKKVFQCGYCDLQSILYTENPQFYNCGAYGWNCDIYCNYSLDIAVTTGYRNMRGREIPREIIKKYDDKAREIIKEQWNNKNYREQLEENAKNFWNELNEL